jgi:hypothetical protein
MTAHSNRVPRPSDHSPSPVADSLATHNDSTQVVGPVPITVWRLDDREDDQPATEPGERFASRLARRLVLTYTSAGDTIVDFDDDLHLHRAATAAGRDYLAITAPDRLADLDQIGEPVSLITLRWPRGTQPHRPADIADLFTACRLMMSGDACVIAAVRPGDPAKPDNTFADHERVLRAAALRAGIAHVLQIVAVSTSGEGDQFLYHATVTQATLAANEAWAPTGGQILHIDLLVFTPMEGRHA